MSVINSKLMDEIVKQQQNAEQSTHVQWQCPLDRETTPSLPLHKTFLQTLLSALYLLPQMINPPTQPIAYHFAQAPKVVTTPHLATTLVKQQAWQLQGELSKTMQRQPQDICLENNTAWVIDRSSKEQCFAIADLEKEFARLMNEARSHLVPAAEEERKFGNKHRNLVKMAAVQKSLELPDLIIPLPYGLSTDQVTTFLQKRAPVVFTLWDELKDLTLDSSEAQSRLKQIDKALQTAFAEEGAEKDLPLSQEMRKWLEQLQETGDSVMVRSTGAEDSHQGANAGGNTSKAYIQPTPQAICQAAGEVVRSYFSLSSLQNRFHTGANPFREPLSLAVLMQQLIGEPIGGSSQDEQIPVSFVAFTSEPLYVGNEEFRAMRISMAPGHGEGVVSSEDGIATDTVLILHSKSQPDQLYVLYNNQYKPERLAPQQKGDEVVLEKVQNSPLLATNRLVNSKMLLNVYTAAIAMEAAFDNHPTDIEGIMKEGKVYFVQARPINRQPLLPHYLDTDSAKEAIVSHLSAEALVPGKGSVATVTDRKEILLTSTLKEAESLFNPQVHKLVIVTHPEPENSHPIVNFSEQSVPCLYASSPEALEKLLSSLGPNRPLLACMQKAHLYVWDETKKPSSSCIKEGFAVHPAKIAISLDLSTHLEKPMSRPLPQDLKDLLRDIRQAKAEEGLALLDSLENHPLLQSLESEADLSLPGVAERQKTLQALSQEIKFAMAELRAQFKDKNSTPLSTLIRIKALETLMIGSARGLAQLSLMEGVVLVEEIAELTQYRDTLPHLLDLLLDGKKANPQAYTAWKEKLQTLESLLKKGEISLEEIAKFREKITVLRQAGILPFWMTFYQDTDTSIFTASDISLLNTLLHKQKEIQGRARRLESFADPQQFTAAWAELKTHIAAWPSTYPVIQSAPSIVQAIGYKTLRDTVTLLDQAIKTMKASPSFSQEIKLTHFKEMVRVYFDLMKGIGRDLVGAKRIPHHTNWPLDSYLDSFEMTLYQLLQGDHEPEQLRASPNFSVSAAIITAKTEFDRHRPQTLEDAMTLAHQNSEAFLAIGNQGFLSPEQVQNSHLPVALAKAISDLERGIWGRTIEKVGIEVGEKEIVVRYNVPLRNHSGHIDLTYDLSSHKLSFKGQLLGEARERWGETASWIRALERAGALLSKQPIFQNEQELTFTWEISSPEDLLKSVQEYVAMAEYSLSRSSPTLGTEFYARWQASGLIESIVKSLISDKNPIGFSLLQVLLEKEQKYDIWAFEILKELYSKENSGQNVQESRFSLLDTLSKKEPIYAERILEDCQKDLLDTDPLVRRAGLVLLNDMVKTGKGYEAAIQAVERHFLEADPKVTSANLNLVATLLSKGQSEKTILQIPKNGISDEKAEIRANSLKLFKELVHNHQGYKSALQAAQTGSVDKDPNVKADSLQLFKELVHNHQGYKAALQAAQTGSLDENTKVKIQSLELFKELVDNNQGYETAIQAAERGSLDNDTLVTRSSFELFWAILFKGQGREAAFKAADRRRLDKDTVIRRKSFFIFKTFVIRYQGYEAAIQGAQQASLDEDPEIRKHRLELFNALVEQGQSDQEASLAAEKGSTDANVEVRHASLELLTTLVQKGQSYETASQAAKKGSTDANVEVRRASLALLTALVQKGQSYETASQAAKKGILDRDREIRNYSLDILLELVKKQQDYETAIQAAEKMLLTREPDLKVKCLEIFTLLVKNGQGYKEAAQAVKKGLADPHNIVKNASQLLRDALAQI